MIQNGFSYVDAVPIERPRAAIPNAALETFYDDLQLDLAGVHPSLVFNADEMGVKAFADRKTVKVFLPAAQVPERGLPRVGIPRASHRCTLLACIALDGTRTPHLLITKTKTINSLVFEEGGYDTERLRIFFTKRHPS